MIRRVLVAVDDSPDALAAVRFAIGLAGQVGGELRVVHVSADHVLEASVEAASGLASVALRRAREAAGMLDRARELAQAAGVAVQTDLRQGDVGPQVLHAAHAWEADVVVIGRSTQSLRGAPYVGVQTRHVLEFAEQPVIVVPRR